MLSNIVVVLFKPKFPENIGMVARACVNMGVDEIVVVAPERWDAAVSSAVATPKGAGLVASIRVVGTLQEAVTDCHYVYGTTARIGGWRSELLSPEKASSRITEQIHEDARVAVLFGPEDRGLTNEETDVCSHLITIPVNPEASSLNLAQAVLIILYECFKHYASDAARPAKSAGRSPLCTHAEQDVAIRTLQETLVDIEYLPEENTEYFMQPMRRALQKMALRRKEFSMLMGICRQIQRKLSDRRA